VTRVPAADDGEAMLLLLQRILVVALVLAAADSLQVRMDHPWRPVEARLFLQAGALWTIFALAATFPARLTRGFLAARGWGSPTGETDGLREGLVLLFWSALPVLAHGTLDRYTGFVGLASLKSPRPWLEVLAVGLLLAFVVVGLDRVLRRFPLGRLRWVGLAAVLIVGLFLPLRADRWAGKSQDGSAHAATAGSTASKRPNVLLLVLDTCRSDRLTPYGYGPDTSPHLARFAEEAHVFLDSLSVARFTLTSHVSLLTGLSPSTHGTRLTNLRFDRRRAKSVAELFHANGYRTGGFVGTDVLSGRTGVRSGFEKYDDQVDPLVCDTGAWALIHDVQSLLAELGTPFRQNGLPHWIQDFQRPANLVLESALSWIEDTDERPWFCMINLYDVHWPYLPTGDARAEFVGDYAGPMDGYLFRSDRWEAGYDPTEADRRHISELYDAEIHHLDALVDGFLGQLGLEQGDTAVVLTSDHGEAFGEAGHWKHEDILEPQVRVPLLVRPAAEEPFGRRVDRPVSALDVAPTLLGLAGLEIPEAWPGLDLLRVDLPPERVRLVEDRDDFDPERITVGLYSRHWKLVRRGFEPDAHHALFDLRTDRIGQEDVQEEHPAVFKDLVEELAELRRVGDVRDKASESLTQSAEGLKALGYLGGDD
jgi:arylsulfatase A-like enzyme